jgi:hypothetical protein
MGQKLFLIFCAVVGVIVYYSYSERQKSLAELAKLKIDMEVSELLPGRQDAWIAYVERRVAAAIQSRAGAISVTQHDETIVVSRNTPFKVRCSPGSGSIEFGYGENAVTVPVYGWFDDRDAEPALGVIRSSVAAANLSKTLCERISDSMNKIVQP